MNKVTFIGRLADVQHFNTNGVFRTVFHIVVEEEFYNKHTNQYDKIISNFFPVLFGKRSEGLALAQNPVFKKGHLVSIEARIRSSQYTVNGTTKYGYDFIVEDINLLSRTLDEMLASRQAYQASNNAHHVDCPF